MPRTLRAQALRQQGQTWQPIGFRMTPRDFGRLAETLVGKVKWTRDDKDAAILALREAEKRLLGAD